MDSQSHIKNLKKTFGNNVILENINFSLLEGESLAIIGASGSGKSVLLKNIIGLLNPDTGSIKINSTEMVNLPRRDKENILLQLGITFQHGALFDSLRIWENIIFKIHFLTRHEIQPKMYFIFSHIKSKFILLITLFSWCQFKF